MTSALDVAILAMGAALKSPRIVTGKSCKESYLGDEKSSKESIDNHRPAKGTALMTAKAPKVDGRATKLRPLKRAS